MKDDGDYYTSIGLIVEPVHDKYKREQAHKKV